MACKKTRLGSADHVLRSIAFIVTFMTLAAALPTQAQAQQFMSEAELLATIPGNQVSAISNEDGKTKWVQAYSAYKGRKNGVISGLWDGKDTYQAKWSVKNGQWCEEWDSGQACWQVEKVGNKGLRIYSNGKPLKNIWKLK